MLSGKMLPFKFPALSAILATLFCCPAQAELIISEFVADSAGAILDSDGDDSDWIEIHNPTDGTLSTAGLFLTDDRDLLTKWPLPSIDLAPLEYILVFASGKDRRDPTGELHTNFSLAASGEYLALIGADGVTPVAEFADEQRQFFGTSFGFGIPEDAAAGTTPQLGYLAEPTPRAANAALEFTDFVRDTTFDVDRGFFDAPIDVTIASPTLGSTIVYTTNGDTPTLDEGIQVTSSETTAPIATVTISTTTPLRAAAFKDGLRPTNIDTQTYLFLDDVVVQPEQPEGYPLPWAQLSGRTTVELVGTYEMSPAVVDAVYSRDELKEALRDLPTISIVTDVDNLFDPSRGIQVNPEDAGVRSERRVSVEFIDFDNSPDLQLDAGIRMNGNASRRTDRPKHNYRLAFRSEYGAGRLRYPVFGENAATDTFNQLVIRGFNGDAWTHPNSDVFTFATYIRDQWYRDSLRAMGYPEVLQREAHVYFNGLYWGVHHIFERIEDEWAAERFGGEDVDWEGFRIVSGTNIEIIAGTPAEEGALMLESWNTVLEAAAEGDLATVEQFLDLDQFMDYVILNYHGGNGDWDQNNVRVMRRINPPGKFQWFCHDTERAGFASLSNPGIRVDITRKNTTDAPTAVVTNLRRNPRSSVEFNLRFADRVYKQLFNDGPLTPENGAARWAARADILRNPLKAESARWGDYRDDGNPLTLVQWEASLDRELNDWFPERTPITIQQLRNVGLYPPIDPPVFNQHGGSVPNGFQVTLSNLDDATYITTDGTDPRLPDGSISPTASLVTDSTVITISGSQTLKARSLTTEGTFSALTEATFLAGTPLAGNLVISELYYNPPGPDGDNEFIELMNRSADTLDLSGIAFTAGITYTFPDGTSLAPGARLVLNGPDYAGNLDNGGETITLSDVDGSIILSFRYNDRAPWPLAADGDGQSLTLIAPASAPDPTLPASWRSSVTVGGTPGSTDAALFTGSTAEEFLVYALGTETSPLQPSVDTIEVDGDDGDYLVIEFPFNQAADDIFLEVQFSTDLETWTTATEGFLGSAETAGSLPRLRWHAPAPVSDLAPRFQARVRVSLRPDES